MIDISNNQVNDYGEHSSDQNDNYDKLHEFGLQNFAAEFNNDDQKIKTFKFKDEEHSESSDQETEDSHLMEMEREPTNNTAIFKPFNINKKKHIKTTPLNQNSLDGKITPNINTLSNESQNTTQILLKEFSEVFVWGSDKYGQLGIDSQYPNENYESTPQGKRPTVHHLPRICSFNVVIEQISCGLSHAALLTINGHLYMMGSNSKGQLGVGVLDPQTNQHMIPKKMGSPQLVESLRLFKVEQVACGCDFTYAIVRADQECVDKSPQVQRTNEIYSWGNNRMGQLAQDESVEVAHFPRKVKALDVLEDDFVQVSAGYEHVLFLTSSNDVISCGNNQHGQCGFDPDECQQTFQPFKIAGLESHQVIQVSAGYQHSLFLTTNESSCQVLASGANNNFQLGVGNELQQTKTPTLITKLFGVNVKKVVASQTSACITDEGHLFIWGKTSLGIFQEPELIQTISNQVDDVTLGVTLSVALDVNGVLWSWGANKHGELGFGDKETRSQPFPIQSLKGKHVTKISCGGQFAICLGQNIAVVDNQAQKLSSSKHKNPKSKQRSKSKSVRQNEVQQQLQKSANINIHVKSRPGNTLSKSFSSIHYRKKKPTVTNASPHAQTVGSDEIEMPKVKESENLKLLRSQNTVMKQEYFKQTQLISKLESKIEKLQSNTFTNQQVLDLKLEVQKLSFKLQKASEKIKLQEKVNVTTLNDLELSKKREQQLENQITAMQKQAHSIRESVSCHQAQSDSKDQVIAQLEQQIKYLNESLQQKQSEILSLKQEHVTESKRIQNELKLANAQLKNMDHLKMHVERELQQIKTLMEAKSEKVIELESQNFHLQNEIKNMVIRVKKEEYENFVSGFSSSIKQSPIMQHQQSKTQNALQSDMTKAEVNKIELATCLIEKTQKLKQQAVEQQSALVALVKNNRTNSTLAPQVEHIEKTVDRVAMEKVVPRRRDNSITNIEKNFKETFNVADLDNQKEQQFESYKHQKVDEKQQLVIQPLPQQPAINADTASASDSMSLRDKYSERLIKQFESKAMAKMQQMKSATTPTQ